MSTSKIVSANNLTADQKHALINATRHISVPITPALQKGWEQLRQLGLVDFCHDFCFTWMKPTEAGEKVRQDLLNAQP